MKTGGWRRHGIVCSLDTGRLMGVPYYSVNQAALKLKRASIQPILDTFAETVAKAG